MRVFGAVGSGAWGEAVRVLAFALCAVLLWGLTVVYLEGTYRQQCAGDVRCR
jgi:hypothetical protein